MVQVGFIALQELQIIMMHFKHAFECFAKFLKQEKQCWLEQLGFILFLSLDDYYW